MVDISNWTQAKPHIQKFLDEISQYGSCKLLLMGGVGLFYHANKNSKEAILEKRPPTDDGDYAWVDGKDIFELSAELGVPNHISGIVYQEDPFDIYHELIEPSCISGEGTSEYKNAEQAILDGKISPIMTSKNEKVGLYFNINAWKVNKEKSRRDKDIRDLELMAEIG